MSDSIADSAALEPVYKAIDGLVSFAARRSWIEEPDEDWARTQIVALFGLASEPAPAGGGADPADADGGPANGIRAEEASDIAKEAESLLSALTRACEDAGLMDPADEQSVQDEAMGALMPRPSELQRRFSSIERRSGGMAAMHWFYRHCVASGYVKKARLDRNPRFESHGLIVTINLAKPEFTSQAKATAGNKVGGGYPKCTICRQNEGFAGRDKRTLRTIPVTLGGQPYFWQYSPYGYFDEHGICVNRTHTPMRVDRDTFVHLLDFVDRFPGYFLGCNAALPRIGGSVLAHDHYQGGGETMPMHKAKAWKTLRLDGHPEAVIEILDWPGTAVRVVSRSRDEVVGISERIRAAWAGYSNPGLGIECRSPQGDQQSSVSPSAIITGRGYEMNIIFRNNAVSEQYPQGVFHAHPEYFAIKQEPVGLIEAQGLFILPGRLVRQLGLIEDALVAGAPLPRQEAAVGPQWKELSDLLDTAGTRDRETVRQAIRDELGSVCYRILGNTAVFKDKADTQEFLEQLGFAASDE